MARRRYFVAGAGFSRYGLLPVPALAGIGLGAVLLSAEAGEGVCPGGINGGRGD